jgi:hypothetical protein
MQGTIDFKNVAQLFDAIAMLKGSPAWTADDAEGMELWMGQYIEYLQTERLKPEVCSVNNHGTYYDLQYISILRFLGRREEAKHHVNTVARERLKMQIKGAMLPQELIRPKSYAYVDFELEAYVRLALQAEALGEDLWNAQSFHFNSILVRLHSTATPTPAAAAPAPRTALVATRRHRTLVATLHHQCAVEGTLLEIATLLCPLSVLQKGCGRMALFSHVQHASAG